MTLDELSRAGTVRSRATRCSSSSSIDGAQTSHLKGFSPECCREWTFRDMLRLNDLPHVSQVNGISLVWAERHRGTKSQRDSTHKKNNDPSHQCLPQQRHKHIYCYLFYMIFFFFTLYFCSFLLSCGAAAKN